MPKTDIDYSNTIFYKIYCKNPDVKDVYIGHTTNFVQRKYAHKRSCTNEKNANYNCKVYNVMREFGGWNNWKMEIIAFHECADHYAARKIEQQYFKEYIATLNSIEPLPKQVTMQQNSSWIKTENNRLQCKICDVYFQSQYAYDKHQQTNKHLKLVLKHNNPDGASIRTQLDEAVHKSSNILTCILCDYTTCKQSNYNIHLTTAKHANRTEQVPNNANNFDCECGRKYNARNSLWYHKQKCTYTPSQLENTIIYAQEEKIQPTAEQSSSELIMLLKELILQLNAKDKQLYELQNTMTEIMKNMIN